MAIVDTILVRRHYASNLTLILIEENVYKPVVLLDNASMSLFVMVFDSMEISKTHESSRETWIIFFFYFS